MDRLEHLNGIYLKISYFQYAEEKDPHCSPAVLECCRIFKKMVWDEYYAIVDRRAGRTPRAFSPTFHKALSAVVAMDTRGNA